MCVCSLLALSGAKLEVILTPSKSAGNDDS
jgi:hypothetical protein